MFMLVLVSLLLEIGDDLIGYKDAVAIVTGIALAWSQHLQEAYIPAALRHYQPPIPLQGVWISFDNSSWVFDPCAVWQDWFLMIHFCLFDFEKKVPCSVGNTETTLHGESAPPDEDTWKLASCGAAR